jgi:beta-lactamase regulating signal transducer with metallopeptidase domain
MREIVFDALQTSGLGTLLFIFLLCSRRIIFKHCGVRFWHGALLANTALFVVPIYPLKLALAPLVLPLRFWIQYTANNNSSYHHSIIAETPSQNEIFIRSVIILWLTGMLALFAIKTIRHALFTTESQKRLRAVPVTVSEIFTNQILQDKTLNKANRLSNVELSSNDDFASPITYGLFRKRIILPGNNLALYDEGEIYLMLRHEALHIQNKDSWKRFLLALAHAINWFNPILFLFTRYLNESMELCCDEKVVTHQKTGELRLIYAELLVSMASNQRKHSIYGQFMSNKGFIEQRVRSITETIKKQSKPMAALFSSLLIIISVVYLTGFTIADRRIDHTYQINVVDSGEESLGIELTLPPARAEATTHDLSGDGGYIYEGCLLADIVNYVPADFLTRSSKITLTTQAETASILVYIYYSSDLEYPLMQLILDGKNPRQSFTALSFQQAYSIGLIVTNFEGEVQISIQE